MQFEVEAPFVVAIVPFSGAIFLGDKVIATTLSSVSDALSLSRQCGTLPNTGVDLRRSERVDSFLNFWHPPVRAFSTRSSIAVVEGCASLANRGL